MTSKSNQTVTKTLNPLHFEDLEPHRFEDLVRQLIYDFKDWQSIEATGQAGSDDGFDIRAWERNLIIITNKEDDESDEEVIGQNSIEGNLNSNLDRNSLFLQIASLWKFETVTKKLLLDPA